MSSAPDPVHALRRNDAADRYEAALDGHHAVVIYTRAGDRNTLVHTIVPPALEGRGVGNALVRYALDAARAQGWRVVPECPFVHAYRRRHPADLAFVPPDARVAIAPGAGPGDAGLPT